MKMLASHPHGSSGFTLIETMVAVSVLAVAIVAPMSLAAKSLASAYYARDQVTAYFLAQEAIEDVRHLRDKNVLLNAQSTSIDLFDGIPVGTDFIIDTRTDAIWAPAPGVAWTQLNCAIPPLKKDAGAVFYGYGSDPCNASEPGWMQTAFTRTVHADYVDSGRNEVRLTVRIDWQTGSFVPRTFTLSDNLYRWVDDGSTP